MSDKKRANINPSENGPYLVEGILKLTRFGDGKEYEVKARAALCRCGGSKNKPFCDGTHKNNGFSSAKAPDRVADKRDNYSEGALEIHDNRGLCAHAGKCTDGLGSVFKLGTEPWIDPKGAPVEEIVKTISQCPSGALSYSLDGADHSERGGEFRAAFVPNGPYVIGGGADLEGVQLLEGATLDHFALCRCGASTNKPFCSGAHWSVQFDEDAPPRK